MNETVQKMGCVLKLLGQGESFTYSELKKLAAVACFTEGQTYKILSCLFRAGVVDKFYHGTLVPPGGCRTPAEVWKLNEKGRDVLAASDFDQTVCELYYQVCKLEKEKAEAKKKEAELKKENEMHWKLENVLVKVKEAGKEEEAAEALETYLLVWN